MHTKVILLTGLFAALGASGCQSIGNQSRNLAVQAGKMPTQQLTLGELQLARGRAYLDAELTTPAIGQFRLAQQDPQTLAAASNGLGVAYARLDRHDLAERYFAEALAAEPGSERYARNLAMLRGTQPALAVLPAQALTPAKAETLHQAEAKPSFRLVRLSRGEVHIGNPGAKEIDAAPPAKLAANEEEAVITVIGPRRTRPAYPLIVKLDQIPGLAQARAEHRPIAMTLMPSARSAAFKRPVAKAAQELQNRAKIAAYPIVVDLTR